MYTVQDTVLYGKNGVCRIVDIEERRNRMERKQYYVMHPVFKEDLTLYAPVGNEEKLGMKPVLTEDELDELLDQAPVLPSDWIDDARARKEEFDAVLSSGDRCRMLDMMRALQRRQSQLQHFGKQLGAKDAIYLKDVRRCVYDEIALVMQIAPDEVAAILKKKFKEKAKEQKQEQETESE